MEEGTTMELDSVKAATICEFDAELERWNEQNKCTEEW